MPIAESILAYVRRRLEEARGSWESVADTSGVPYSTLVKIAQGATTNPRLDTIGALLDHFDGIAGLLASPVAIPAAEQQSGETPHARSTRPRRMLDRLLTSGVPAAVAVQAAERRDMPPAPLAAGATAGDGER